MRHAAAGGMTTDDEKVFDYGDRTIFQLRAQSFSIDTDYGTMIGPVPVPSLPIVETAVDVDPMARLEEKLDLALRQIALLQQKLDSIDVTLARALNR
ncbi:MAG TPA: hypothetical protein VND45_14845 [Thermoanaerobaculia bacterium]|jgi:hypothetical protein|nr:hypothetical protein [Thermoanaerobaculia bacterium]